ncbi:TetR/AcrR family transcriptional regulator [Cryptosporangium phraense]|uniref:TetR/AcrR family transcriptional regulator n=1 Tax=Cryptosporangium phraense TaxID=2593070 RepID=A0A545AZZ4_9ACTN|nr:TetR/AcrR family transcriptional regulator [Cryptosporangium phraense]TQS46900.1 TetR/AcrR family transcriptional regulator [Cryptosporangium phraense]
MTSTGVRRGRPPSGGREAILRAALQILRERGASRLTTKEVAQRAGVSEGSVFYHFSDRAGLLTAVIEDALSELKALNDGELHGDDVSAVLDRFTGLVESFLDRTLTSMIAAQSDADLRAALVDHLAANDMGAHRGIQILSAYVRGAQKAGAVRADVDPDAVATLIFAVPFLHAAHRQLLGDEYLARLPGRRELLDTLDVLLR